MRVCSAGREQFCAGYEMVGNTLDGGFAEFVAVPERNAVPVPDGVPMEQAAIMMCSTATALHALRRGRLMPGETVAVFGVGGLGQSAVRLAAALGAGEVFAVDLDHGRLAVAAAANAIGVDAANANAMTALSGTVDVALEMVGSADVYASAIRALGKGGRAVAVGLSHGSISVAPYEELVGGELELIGSNDHTRSEVVEVLELAAAGRLDLSDVISETVALSSGAINGALDRIDRFGPGIRSVVVPG